MKIQFLSKKIISCLLFLLLTGSLFLIHPERIQAATPGFHTVNGNTYYIDADGSKHSGWLTLKGKKYYFNPTTKYMLKGWQYDSKKKPIRYFDSKTGVMATGWLKNSSGKYRYFNTKTGIMILGWYKNPSGQYRYFNLQTGIMVTGWLKNSSGQYRYFNKSNGIMLTGYHYSGKNLRYFNAKTGIMTTGWAKGSSGLRYFNTSSGIMATGWIKNKYGTRYFYATKPASGIGSYGLLYSGFKKVNGKYYYFTPATTVEDAKNVKKGGYMAVSCFKTISGKTFYFQSNGQARTGWMTLNNKKYYFNSNGVMYKNKTVTLNNVTYQFDANGVASVLASSGNRTYTIYSAINNIPAGTDDITLLAAVADREMGGAGKNGMIGVCMCILNRTLPENTAFPTTIRNCIYQSPNQFLEHDGTFTVLERKLYHPGTSNWANEKEARAAATEALKIFNAYKNNGTKRDLRKYGYKTTDFNYIGFMTPSAIASAMQSGGLNPNVTETYGGICTYYDCYNKAWGNK